MIVQHVICVCMLLLQLPRAPPQRLLLWRGMVCMVLLSVLATLYYSRLLLLAGRTRCYQQAVAEGSSTGSICRAVLLLLTKGRMRHDYRQEGLVGKEFLPRQVPHTRQRRQPNRYCLLRLLLLLLHILLLRRDALLLLLLRQRRRLLLLHECRLLLLRCCELCKLRFALCCFRQQGWVVRY
jgi:hypothetical protein